MSDPKPYFLRGERRWDSNVKIPGKRAEVGGHDRVSDTSQARGEGEKKEAKKTSDISSQVSHGLQVSSSVIFRQAGDDERGSLSSPQKVFDQKANGSISQGKAIILNQKTYELSFSLLVSPCLAQSLSAEVQVGLLEVCGKLGFPFSLPLKAFFG